MLISSKIQDQKITHPQTFPSHLVTSLLEILLLGRYHRSLPLISSSVMPEASTLQTSWPLTAALITCFLFMA